jgi:hypothetical protein
MKFRNENLKNREKTGLKQRKNRENGELHSEIPD